MKQQVAEMNLQGTTRKSGATSIALNAFPVGIDAKHQSTIKKIEKQRKESQEVIVVSCLELDYHIDKCYCSSMLISLLQLNCCN